MKALQTLSLPHKRIWNLKSLSNLHKITKRVVSDRAGLKLRASEFETQVLSG